jgi:hypothetical protein
VPSDASKARDKWASPSGASGGSALAKILAPASDAATAAPYFVAKARWGGGRQWISLDWGGRSIGSVKIDALGILQRLIDPFDHDAHLGHVPGIDSGRKRSIRSKEQVAVRDRPRQAHRKLGSRLGQLL